MKPARLNHQLLEATDIGARLMAGRGQRLLTQDELAAILGVAQRTISRWESGAICPTAVQLAALCKVLQLSADDVLAAVA